MRVIFGDTIEKEIDPNNPGYVAFVNKKKSQQRENLELWVEEGGNIVLDSLAKDVRAKVLKAIATDRASEKGKEESLSLLNEIKLRIEFLIRVSEMMVQARGRADNN